MKNMKIPTTFQNRYDVEVKRAAYWREQAASSRAKMKSEPEKLFAWLFDAIDAEGKAEDIERDLKSTIHQT